MTCCQAHRGVGELSPVGVQALGQPCIERERLFPTAGRKSPDVGHGRVGERHGGGLRHSAWHICHAVVDAVVDRKRGISVGGGFGSLEATALIHGNVNEDAPWLHSGDKVQGYELRCFSAGYQYRPNHEVGGEAGPLDFQRV